MKDKIGVRSIIYYDIRCTRWLCCAKLPPQASRVEAHNAAIIAGWQDTGKGHSYRCPKHREG